LTKLATLSPHDTPQIEKCHSESETCHYHKQIV